MKPIFKHIQEEATTPLLMRYIHGKARTKQDKIIKDLIEKELIKRGVIENE
jgi:hypothetical protein